MEAILQMQRGEPPSLLRHGPPRDPASHPSAPHVIWLRGLAPAVTSELMAGGVPLAAASQLVADEMQDEGVTFVRSDSDPASPTNR
jgi:hypothetical protein